MKANHFHYKMSGNNLQQHLINNSEAFHLQKIMQVENTTKQKVVVKLSIRVIK